MSTHKNLIKFIGYSYNRTYDNLPKGWKVLIESENLVDNLSGFSAVAFINENTKQIIIANKGAAFDFNDLKGIYQDIHLWVDIYNKNIPMQFTNGVIPFIKALQANLLNGGSGYVYINIGHSSGSILSDLSTLYLKKMGYDSCSITYENPGSKPILEHYAKALGLSVQKLKDGYIAINAEVTLLNTMHDHHGTVARLASNYEEGASLLSFLGIVLKDIGAATNIVYGVYNIYASVGKQLKDKAHKTKNNTDNSINKSEIIKLVLPRVAEVGDKTIEFEKAYYLHKFDNIVQMIEECGEGDPDRDCHLPNLLILPDENYYV
jgi:hypothetical protein